jgi:hypothetical protein
MHGQSPLTLEATFAPRTAQRLLLRTSALDDPASNPGTRRPNHSSGGLSQCFEFSGEKTVSSSGPQKLLARQTGQTRLDNCLHGGSAVGLRDGGR